MQRVREKAARLIHCEADDIASVANASTALGILLAGLDWRAGDRILTLEHEFPNNLYAPGLLDRAGVEMVEMLLGSLLRFGGRAHAPGLPQLGELQHRLRAAAGRDRPIFCASAACCSISTGRKAWARCSSMSSRIQPDMLAVHAYKWMISPNGAGFMYVSPELRRAASPQCARLAQPSRLAQCGQSAPRRSRIGGERGEVRRRLGYLRGDLRDGSFARFDVSRSGRMRLSSACWTWPKRLARLLRRHGARVDLCGSPIVAARFENRDVSALAKALKEQRVLVAARRGHLRVSPHFYNNEQDLEIFGKALRECSSFRSVENRKWGDPLVRSRRLVACSRNKAEERVQGVRPTPGVFITFGGRRPMVTPSKTLVRDCKTTAPTPSRSRLGNGVPAVRKSQSGTYCRK